MKKTLLTIAGIGLLSTLFVYPVFSHNPGGYFRGHQMGQGYQMGQGRHMGSGYMGQGHHSGPWQENTALTEEQRGKISKLQEGFAADSNDTRQQLREKATALNALLATQEPDKTQALKIQKELNVLRNKMAEKRLAFELEVKKIAPEAGSQNAFCAGPGAGRRHMPW